MMVHKKIIDEFFFGGGSLLGIQKQVDDLVTIEVVVEIRFDDSSTPNVLCGCQWQWGN